jgi:DNA adenine methylase Dam
LHQEILGIIKKFNLSQSYVNGYAAYNAESTKGLGSYNKEGYLRLRAFYNASRDKKSSRILLLVLIIYSFNNQIRFNGKGEFNLPVGKRDYNGNTRKNLAAFNLATNTKKLTFTVGDFRSLLDINFDKKDFVYLDPPYLLGLASYNESGGWSKKYEHDLYSILSDLNKRGIRFALSNVLEHKGETNDILQKWVDENGFTMHKLNFSYKNSNYQSTAKNGVTSEVLITNYA